ncbi:MAG: c-type cytochrome [Rhodoferax sp.]
MKRIIPFTLLGVASLLALDVQAQNPDLQARVWSASCAACHGTNGHSQGVFLSIGGVDKAQLLQKLIAYKKDQLAATVMHQHAKGYTDAELERLADYFSRQKPLN